MLPNNNFLTQLHFCSRSSLEYVVTEQRAGGFRVRIIFSKTSRLVLSSTHPFQREPGLTTHLHLVSKLRISGSVPQLLLYAFMARTGNTARLTFLHFMKYSHLPLASVKIWNLYDFIRVILSNKNSLISPVFIYSGCLIISTRQYQGRLGSKECHLKQITYKQGTYAHEK